MTHPTNGRRRPLSFLFEYSVFLIVGTAVALIWANSSPGSYKAFVETPLVSLVTGSDAGSEHKSADAVASHSEPVQAIEPSEEKSENDGITEHKESHAHVFNMDFLINDVLMALFFAIAAKEVLEALLPGGALSNPRKAATPVLATIGGVAGPATLYLLGAALFSPDDPGLRNGWAIPCATDIAFSYLVARLIFGPGHPAIAFLLLLAIADDALGLIILAVFYPSGELKLSWLLLTAASFAVALLFRKKRLGNHWWYLAVPGVMSWLSFFKAGIHPALGLVPVVAAMPHAHTDLGIFMRSEMNRDDTLNAFEHFWKNKVEVILGLFGLVNAGVVVSNVGVGTWLVLVGLLVGKPIGIILFTLLGEKVFRLQIPGGMSYRHVFSLGMIAGIGFTVALFVSTAAFPDPGVLQDSVKMGALASFFAAIVAYAGSRMMGIRALPAPTIAEESVPDE